MRRLTIGVDVGGTKVLARAVDPLDPLVPIAEHRVDTPQGADPLLAAIAEAVAEVGAQLAPSAVAQVGVGLPALVGHDGTVAFATHIAGLRGLDAGARLTTALGVPVVVGNDANCAALAEARVGAGGGVDDVVVVTLGTGIGGGVVAGGRLLTGARGYAGEIGHVQLVEGGRPCQCGRLGCWEQYASGDGLGISARLAAAEGRLASVTARVGDVEAIRGEHVVAAAADGAPDALAVLDQHGRWVALGLADLANVLDPAVIVLGGGLVAAGELLLGPVRRAFAGLPLGGADRSPVPIEAAVLGPAAGAIGAALLVADRLGGGT